MEEFEKEKWEPMWSPSEIIRVILDIADDEYHHPREEMFPSGHFMLINKYRDLLKEPKE